MKKQTCAVPEGETPITWEGLKRQIADAVLTGILILIILSAIGFWFTSLGVVNGAVLTLLVGVVSAINAKFL